MSSSSLRPLSTGRAYGYLAVAVAAAYWPSYIPLVMWLVVHGVGQPPAPQGWGAIALGWGRYALILALVIGVCYYATSRVLGTTMRDGLGLSRTSPRVPDPRRRAAGPVWTCVFAYVVFDAGIGVLYLVYDLFHGFPAGDPATPAQAWHTVIAALPKILMIVPMELLLIVGLVPLLLDAASRPRSETYAAAALINTGMHAYWGWAALVYIPLTCALVWLYLRSGRLVPIMVAYTAYNLLVGAMTNT